MLESRSKARLSFGPFELDGGRNELRKHGVRVRLARQPWQVLQLLTDRAGQIVTREEIRQQLWSDDTFVDFDHGLNATMNRLRQALGDSADAPRYIETVPGQGYRFLAPIQILPDSEPEPPLAPKPQDGVQPASLHGRRHVTFAVAGVLLLLLVLLGFSMMAARRAPEFAPRPVTFTIPAPPGFALESAGSRQAFAISPDGSRLAFTALGDDGQFRLWVRDLSVLEPREVPNTHGLHSVFWSPDSESLYYSVRGSVRRIPADGTAHHVICELPQVLHLGTWLSADRMMLSNRIATFVAPAAGGTAVQLRETYVWPQVLPDGKHILHVQYDPRMRRNRLKISEYGGALSADLLETDSRVIYVSTSDSEVSDQLLYVRGGTLLAHPFDAKQLRLTGDAVPIAGSVHFFQPTGAADFSVSDAGTLVYQSHQPGSHLKWLDRSGRETGQIGGTTGAAKCVRLSPDGRKAAASIHNAESGSTELWVFDTSAGTGRVMVAGPGIIDSPVWSGDSSRIVYSRALGGAPQLFMRGLGEQDREQQLPSTPFQLPTDWSRDGRFVLYTNTAFSAGANELEGNVSLVDLRTQKIRVLLDGPAQETNAVFSPDGRWIAYISNDSGRAEAYVQAFQGGEAPSLDGERFRISTQGALYVRWRGDGKEIAYLGADGMLYGVTIETGRGLRAGVPRPLFRVPVSSRAVLPSMYGFDLSADGSRFLLPTTTAASHLVVIHNWQSLIARKSHRDKAL